MTWGSTPSWSWSCGFYLEHVRTALLFKWTSGELVESPLLYLEHAPWEINLSLHWMQLELGAKCLWSWSCLSPPACFVLLNKYLNTVFAPCQSILDLNFINDDLLLFLGLLYPLFELFHIWYHSIVITLFGRDLWKLVSSAWRSGPEPEPAWHQIRSIMALSQCVLKAYRGDPLDCCPAGKLFS